MEEKVKKIFKRILLLIILSIFITLINFYFSTVKLNLIFFKNYITSLNTLILNFLPIFLIILIIYEFSDKIWFANLFTSMIIFLMGLGNKHKLMYRDEPFTFIDIKLLGEASKMAGQYEIHFTPIMIGILIYILLSSYFLYKFIEDKKEDMNIKIKKIGPIILVTIILLKTVFFSSNIYAKVCNEDIINIWNQSEQFQSKGFIYPFIYSYKSSKQRKIPGYNEKSAKKILDKYKEEDILEDKKVHFISIMLEAYNDFSKYDTIELNEEYYIYENFHKIKDESYHGNLITNVFGGGTINTELSYLTGYNSHPKYAVRRNAYPWYFKDQGYSTEFMHPFYGWFYNRKNVTEYIGFENFDCYENKYKDISEEFFDDYEFFDYIIEGFEKAKKDNKFYFHHSTTYQNHGPYRHDITVDERYLLRKPEYTNGEYNIINNYFSGIYKTDKALKKLTDYLRDDEEPVILVLFGDHNPWLGDGNSVYNMLNIDLDLSSVKGFKNYYSTPYIFWANNKAKEVLGKDFKQKGRDVSPNFLMAELFKYIGYKGSSYMQYMIDVSNTFTVNNDLRFKTNKGYSKDLNDIDNKKWIEYNWVQYYYGNKFFYEK